MLQEPLTPDVNELDRLEWSTLAFTSHGRRLGVRANEPAVLERAVAHLPPGRRPTPEVDALYSVWTAPHGSGEAHVLYRDGQRFAHSDSLDHLLARLESELHFDVATHARACLFVHAGAVAWEGRGILIPGRSGAGKSELTAALVRAGATYYSDEYAVLDAKGLLHPYAKPLGVRRHGAAKVRVGGMPDPGTACPVGAVVVTRFAAGASWSPRPVTPGRAMVALLDNTVLARERPRTAMTTLARAASGVIAFEGARGEADATAGELLAQVARGR